MELYNLSVVDFGPYEKLELSLYKQGLVWVGGQNNDTASADSNGSGKSTIFKAITWGLYGETIDGEKGDKVIRDGTNKAIVDVSLINQAGDVWKISRSRSKGIPRVVIFRPDGKLFDGGKQEIQDHITRMVGLDFKAFRNTVLYGQNDSARFANPQTKDAERKSMLHRILNTELLAACHKMVTDVARTLKADVKDLENASIKQRDAAKEHDVSGLREQYNRWIGDNREAVEILVNRAKECKKKAEDLALIKEELPKLDVSSLECEIELKTKQAYDIEKNDHNVAIYKKNAEDMEIKHAEYIMAVNLLVKERDNIDGQLKLLDGDKCPVCTTSLVEGTARLHVGGLKKHRKEINNNLEKVQINMSTSKISLDAARVKYTQAYDKTRELPAILKKITVLKSQINEAHMFHTREVNRINEIQNRINILVDEARNRLLDAKKEKGKENPYTIQLDKAVSRVAECEKKIVLLTAEIKKKCDELSYYEFWTRGFSNQGLPSFILDHVMPQITERANYYLETLSDSDITMSFSTQRELKSSKGEMRDEIEIRWSIEGHDMYPPSGGQLKKMEIATDLALMDLVASNEGSSLDILMMDEVLDGLDAEGSSRVLTLLQKLRSRRGSIFVVTHDSKMAEIFEKGIQVLKQDGVATLEAM
jgi:DNA repair exonuclease SbcCD ATPase subunit